MTKKTEKEKKKQEKKEKRKKKEQHWQDARATLGRDVRATGKAMEFWVSVFESVQIACF